MKYAHVNFEDAYTLSEQGYLMEAETDMASLMAQSNGYMGVRASLEEYGTVSVQGAFIRGIIDACPCAPIPVIDNEYMKRYYFDEEKIRRFQVHTAIVNFADFLLLRFSINGEAFYPWEGKVLEWKRSLDMKTNRLVRSVVWENSKGERTRFCFERFASYDDNHVFAMKVMVEPLNYSGAIEVMSGIDTLTKSVGSAGGGFLLTTAKKLRVQEGKTFYACNSGEKYGFRIAVGADTRIYLGDAPVDSDWQDAKEPDMAAVRTSLKVEQGQVYTVEKLVSVATERDWEQCPGDCAGADVNELQEKASNAQRAEAYVEAALGKERRYEELLTAHVAAWQAVFGELDIAIEGDFKADTALRFSNYQTIGTFDRNDSIHSLAPKGLSGPGYGGTVWWDCEVYQSPVFYMTLPGQARNLPMYRYRMLEGAKKNALEEGREGARYPFNSAITGEEEVWPVSRHPFMQIHIVSDVAWSICNYYNCTGDDEFLISYGMEMLYEIGRYWLSRVEKEERGYVILTVTGTDEHHPYVDNNAYTNYVLHYVIKRTLELTEQLAGKLSKVNEKAHVTGEFLDSLRDLAEHLYLPMDPVTGMIPQFDGYFDLSRELEVAAGSAGQAKAFQMKTAGMYHKSQVIKQPDVLVLFAYQNMHFSPKVYSRNWDYYRARCESSSSLSYSVHSICASDMEEPESAYTYFMQTAMMDLDDEHDCASQGIHSACAAGAWLALVRGIGGTIIDCDGVKIEPHMIPWWKEVRYSLHWHGQKLSVRLTNESVTVSAAGKNSGEIALTLCGEACRLLPGQEMQKLF